MKKTVVWSCLLFLVASGTVSFAQFQLAKQSLEKGVENAAVRNLAKLQEVTARSAQRLLSENPIVLTIPQGVYQQNMYLGVRNIEIPTPGTLTESYLNLQHDILKNLNAKAPSGVKFTPKYAQRVIAQRWINGTKGSPRGKALYTNQAELARDLDNFYQFYKATPTVTRAPSGRIVEIYELPADNILYKPVGYRVPVVLTAREYFVIYDVQNKTGQLVKKTPATLAAFAENRAFKPAAHRKFATPQQSLEEMDRITEREYLEGTQMDFSHVHRWATPEEEQELARLNRQAEEQRLEEVLESGVGRLGTNEEMYLLKKMENENNLVGENPGERMWKSMNAPKVFASQDHLGYFLQRIYEENTAQVKDPLTGHIYWVYEIPVEGISYVKNDKPIVRLDPKEYVVIYNKREGARIIKRRMIEEERLYEFVQ